MTLMIMNYYGTTYSLEALLSTRLLISINPALCMTTMYLNLFLIVKHMTLFLC